MLDLESHQCFCVLSLSMQHECTTHDVPTVHGFLSPNIFPFTAKCELAPKRFSRALPNLLSIMCNEVTWFQGKSEAKLVHLILEPKPTNHAAEASNHI